MPFLKLPFTSALFFQEFTIHKPLIHCCLLNPCTKILIIDVYKWTKCAIQSTFSLSHVNQGPGFYLKSIYDCNINKNNKITKLRIEGSLLSRFHNNLLNSIVGH